MNQILQVEYKKNNGPVEIKKIVIFFAIAIIIFAIVLIGLGSYIMATQKEKKENNNTILENTKPEINITQEEENIIVDITHNQPLQKITYNWNDEEEKTIQTNNQQSISETIELPFGTNTLNITVTDINGNESKFQKEYVVEGNGKPVIDLKLTTDNKIKIIAQDNTNMQYVIYQWNNDEEKRVEVDANNLTTIEEVIEIPLGQNTLKVQAVNTNNVSSAKELEVKGIKGPEVTFKKQGDDLLIRAEDEVGMKIINFKFNGQKYQINYGNKKVIEYTQKLEKGENNLELTAENQDGGITTKKVKIIN